MRVAIITPWFPNERGGWPAHFIADSAIALSQAGLQIHVGVVRGWLPRYLEGLAGPEHRGDIRASSFPEIERIVLKKYPTVPGELARNLTNIAQDRAVESLLSAEIAAWHPDIIHAHTEQIAPAAVAVAQRHRIPIVVTLHGENTNWRYLAAPAQARRFKSALGAADRLVVVGEPLRAFAARLAARRDHIVVVWNGVTPSREQRKRSRLDQPRLELICVAGLQEGKGVDLLLEALGRLYAAGMRDWRLVIIGDGPLRSELNVQAAQMEIAGNVDFIGTVSNAEVFAHLEKADIFVLPSYREAFGVAYLEAMSAGLLTIGVEGQGASQFITHGKTGILVRPKDVSSLDRTLRDIITDDQRSWRGIASAGAAYVRESCTWSAHAQKLTSVFTDIITTKAVHPIVGAV